MESTAKWVHTELDDQSYKGWTIRWNPFEPPFAYDFYEPSLCFGAFDANKETSLGTYHLAQPVWLSLRELKKLNTPLDKESALNKMIADGLRCIKISINRHRRGLLNLEPINDAVKHNPLDYRNTPFKAHSERV